MIKMLTSDTRSLTNEEFNHYATLGMIPGIDCDRFAECLSRIETESFDRGYEDGSDDGYKRGERAGYDDGYRDGMDENEYRREKEDAA